MTPFACVFANSYADQIFLDLPYSFGCSAAHAWNFVVLQHGGWHSCKSGWVLGGINTFSDHETR